jgi:hypothetical protein
MKINEIFQSYAPEYIQCYEHAMPFEHRKVIDAIINCRTQYYGTAIYDCQECGLPQVVFRSCGNPDKSGRRRSHCPNCQHHKTKQWLEKQMTRQLPGHHFMITFTVPEQLRRFIRSNQQACYSAMFTASSQTLKKLALDEKYIGADLPGFFGVLHTWGRQLQYHPHIHYIVPGGALSKEDGTWHPSRIDFFLPIKAMSKIFKAKFHDEMKKTELYPKMPSGLWEQNFNVNCQPIGSSEQSIKYLAPYVFKVAISDSRIIKVEHRKVYFKYKKTRSERWRSMSLDIMEFIRRFLQHVLPTGFMKVRYYGFLSPSSSVSLSDTRTLIELAYGFELPESKTNIEPIQSLTCPHCGGVLIYRTSILSLRITPDDTG